LTVDDIGCVLLLGADQDEQRLRSVAAIDLDAVLVEAEADLITVREQIELRRVAGLTGAPILLRSIGRPDAAILEAWRDAGAPALLRWLGRPDAAILEAGRDAGAPAVLGPAADTAATLEAARAVPAPRRSTERRLAILGGPAREAEDHEHDHEHEHD